ncbi:hypothetical protein EDB87DRAFT_1582550 [Lactarius vividus]|nr:hypothetical protein EDB87DRAFT_1582550 [Lactarius vividus]
MRRYNLGRMEVNEPGEGYGLTTSSLAGLLTTVLLMQSRLSFLHSSEWQSSQKCMHRHEAPVSLSHSAVMELLGSNSGIASAGGAHAGYQMYQQPFSSSSGSGYTIWYSSSVRFEHSVTTRDSPIKDCIGCSALVDNGKVLPKMRNVPTIMTRVLSIHSNGEPSWVTRATISTTETRREKGAKS